MRCHRFLRLLIALILSGLITLPHTLPAAAQSNAIRFDTLSVEDGLSQSTVRAVLQDSQGFMWFGTDDGLNKYDGYTFTIYKHDHENPLTISDNSVLAIYQDSQGDLWFGTTRGLDRFDREKEIFHHYQNIPGDPLSLRGSSVTAIAEDIYGNLWVATGEGGLNRLNRKDNTFIHYWHDPKDNSSLISDNVTALAADLQGGMWIGTYEGLDYYDPNAGKFIHYRHYPRDFSSLGDNKIISLYYDRSDTLWIGTEEGGLNRFNADERNFKRYTRRPNNPYSLNSNHVRTIFEDSKGRMWVGGRNGLHLFDRSAETFIRYQHDSNNPFSLTNNYVLSITEDHAGVIWIGTYGGGLSKYNHTNDRFMLFQHRPGAPSTLGDEIVTAIFEDKEGIVWIGMMDGGISRYNHQTGIFISYTNTPSNPASLSSNDVRAIYEDRYGTLWIGTFGGGLNRLDRSTGRFEHFRHDPQDPKSLGDDRVLVIYEDSRGELWIGTRGGGLNLLNRATGEFTRFMPDPENPHSLIGDYVNAIHETKSGELWIGTYSGISVMDPETRTFKNYEYQSKNSDSLSNNRILSIYEAQDGIIWIGTLLGGLNRFDPQTGTFRHYTEKQGLPNDAVYGILEDENGHLWLSTNKGLSRFNPETETFRNYDVQDGLQSNEFNAGAYFKNTDGLMYFGGVHGFNAFYPASVVDSLIPPPVVVTAFKKFNQVERKDLLDGEHITLSYQDNFISFEFAALDYIAPNKNQYAYMLEGFDKDWVYAGNRRYASYTNLSGGEYVFRVKGANKDGVWNEIGTTVYITVIPPIWQRWWFIGTAALLVVSAGIGSYWLRMRSIRKQNRRLEEQVLERTQEIERRRLVAEGLREILAILNSNRTLKECLDCIIEQATRLIGAQAVVIFRCGDDLSDDDTFAPSVVASSLPEGIPLSEMALTHSLRNTHQKRGQVCSSNFLPVWVSEPLITGHTLILPDLKDYRALHPDMPDDALQRYGALLGVPLLINDEVDGGIVLLYDEPNPFREEEVQTARSFADHSALAIANARLRSQAEELAVSAERSRLARDLHDAVTQTLFATSLIAEVLPRLWERNPEAGKQKVNEIRELTRGALAEMRTLLMELRPAALEDVPLQDLLQQLSEAFTGRARVPVDLNLDRSITLPPNVKIGFYRIAQEAFNNISKHSRATAVELYLTQSTGGIEMSIRDNGIGFEPHKSTSEHFGLGIMEERAQTIGAQYRIESRLGEGTRVVVCWQAEEEWA